MNLSKKKLQLKIVDFLIMAGLIVTAYLQCVAPGVLIGGEAVTPWNFFLEYRSLDWRFYALPLQAGLILLFLALYIVSFFKSHPRALSKSFAYTVSFYAFLSVSFISFFSLALRKIPASEITASPTIGVLVLFVVSICALILVIPHNNLIKRNTQIEGVDKTHIKYRSSVVFDPQWFHLKQPPVYTLLVTDEELIMGTEPLIKMNLSNIDDLSLNWKGKIVLTYQGKKYTFIWFPENDSLKRRHSRVLFEDLQELIRLKKTGEIAQLPSFDPLSVEAKVAREAVGTVFRVLRK